MNQLAEVLELEETEIHRRDDCKHYEDCLDVAALKRWRSFSCYNCKKYKQGKRLVHITTENKDIYPATVDCLYSYHAQINTKMDNMGIKQFNSMHRVQKARKSK